MSHQRSLVIPALGFQFFLAMILLGIVHAANWPTWAWCVFSFNVGVFGERLFGRLP